MIDVTVPNFLTVGLMALVFLALWHWIAGMIASA